MRGMNMGICVSRVPTPPFSWGPYFPAQTSICTLLHHSGTAAPICMLDPEPPNKTLATYTSKPSYLCVTYQAPVLLPFFDLRTTYMQHAPTYYLYIYIYMCVCVCMCIYIYQNKILQNKEQIVRCLGQPKYYSMSYLHTLNIQS